MRRVNGFYSKNTVNAACPWPLQDHRPDYPLTAPLVNPAIAILS